MIVEGQVGPAALGDGVRPPFRQGRSGEQIVSELHGKYWEQNSRGNVFLAANAAAGTAISAAATASTFTLWNPPSSGKNLVVLSASLSIVSGTLVAGGLHWAAQVNVTAPTSTTAATTVTSGLVGGGASPAGKAYLAATFAAAPVLLRPIASKYPSATASGPVQLVDVPDGLLAVAPGSGLSLVSVGADTTPLWSIGIAWEEVSV